MRTRQQLRQRRHKGIRKNIKGSAAIPRLSVFRSSRHIYVQLVNDESQITLASANDLKLTKGKPKDKAKAVGLALAKIAKKQKIVKVVFDRGGYKYHGRVKSLAEGVREGGLEF